MRVRPCIPLRMSVWPIAIHTLVHGGLLEHAPTARRFQCTRLFDVRLLLTLRDRSIADQIGKIQTFVPFLNGRICKLKRCA